MQHVQCHVYQQLLSVGADPGDDGAGQCELYLQADLQLFRVRAVQRLPALGTGHSAALLKAAMRLADCRFPFQLLRIGALLRRLVKASDGVETIEFALAAIPLLTFLFGVVEFARLYWTQSELQYAAEAAARCATLVQLSKPNPASCGGSSVSNNAGVQ